MLRRRHALVVAIPVLSSPRALVDPTASSSVAHLVLAHGHEYHAEAIRMRGGRWSVSLQPAEGR